MTKGDCRKCPFLKGDKCKYNVVYLGFKISIGTIQNCPLGKDKHKLLKKLNGS